MKAYKRIVLIALLVITVGVFLAGCYPEDSPEHAEFVAKKAAALVVEEGKYNGVLVSHLRKEGYTNSDIYIFRVNDLEANVTCWITTNYYINSSPIVVCIPNNEIYDKGISDD